MHMEKSVIIFVKHLLKYGAAMQLHLSWWCRRGQLSLGSVSAPVLVQASQSCLGKPTRGSKAGLQGFARLRRINALPKRNGSGLGITFTGFLHPGTRHAAYAPLKKRGNLDCWSVLSVLFKSSFPLGGCWRRMVFFLHLNVLQQKKNLFEMFLSHLNISVKESAVNYPSRMMASVISF